MVAGGRAVSTCHVADIYLHYMPFLMMYPLSRLFNFKFSPIFFLLIALFPLLFIARLMNFDSTPALGTLPTLTITTAPPPLWRRLTRAIKLINSCGGKGTDAGFGGEWDLKDLTTPIVTL
jgi:hypothetical protein